MDRGGSGSPFVFSIFYSVYLYFYGCHSAFKAQVLSSQQAFVPLQTRCSHGRRSNFRSPAGAHRHHHITTTTCPSHYRPTSIAYCFLPIACLLLPIAPAHCQVLISTRFGSSRLSSCLNSCVSRAFGFCHLCDGEAQIVVQAQCFRAATALSRSCSRAVMVSQRRPPLDVGAGHARKT